MNKPKSGTWWSALGFGRRQADVQTDFGDMGTAFGLDASLQALADAEGSAAVSEKGRPPSGDRPSNRHD